MNNIHTSNAATEKKAADSTIVGAENYELPIVCDIDILRTLIRKKAARVVDVRKEEEYKQGHIPTAVSMPLAQVLSKDSEGIVDILESIGVSDKLPVIVYDDTFGALAARVAWTFQYVGHTNTSLLEVTFSRWKNLGLPIEKKTNNFPWVEHSLNVNNEIHADSSYVDAIKEQQPNKILIDSR